MPSSSDRRRTAQQRVAEMRKQEQAQERRRRFLTYGGIAGVVAVVAIAIALTSGGPSSGKPKPSSSPPPSNSANVAFATTPPPWGLPNDAAQYVQAAGLTVLGKEQLAVHYHAHLDVIVNGKPVAVPPGIGFEIQGNKVKGLSELHTHDASGVIHIEAAHDDTFVLGQVFDEWGVKLTSTCIGGMCAGNGNVLKAFVNGVEFTGDPTSIVLKRHEEIALWFGPSTQTPNVPKSYKFKSGL